MKKKLFFSIIVAFLGIALLTCSLNDIKVANAAPAYIFSDGFESGNLNAWNVTYGTLSINNQTVNSGVYSVQNIVVGNNENLYNQSLGSSLPNPIYLREYVYINSTTAPSTSGDYYEVGGFSTTQGGNYGDGEICVFNVAGTLYWGVFYRDLSSVPTGFSHIISDSNTTSTAQKVSIGWNCVELQSTTGTSDVNGKEQLYLNGVSIINATSNNYDRVPANVVIGGSQHIANSADRWNYYIDDVVVNSSYIGQLQYQLTMSTNYGTFSPASGPYNESQTVPITATAPVANPGERYIWQGWVGSGVGSYTGPNNPATITMGSNITEQAVWERDYYLTVSSAYGTASGSGWYDAGSSAYAAVNSTTVAGTTGTQYVFTGWSGNASGTTSPSNAITMSGPMTAVANWKTQYYLNVSSANGTVGGTNWYDSGTNATATLNSLTVAGTAGTRYVFTGWSGDASGTTSPSNNITMNGPKTAAANWQTQYNLTFAQSGVGSDFSGTFITVNGTSYNSAGFMTWVNASDVYTFSYAPQLVVTPNAKQCLLTGVSGNSTASTLTASAATTITGTYKTQYYLTSTSAYDSPSPANGWYDSGSSISAFVASPVSGSSGTQYVCTGWSGTGSVPDSGSASAMTFTISAPSTITWNWKTQYLVSFAVSPSGAGTTSPSGTNTWQDAGSISISGTPSYNYKFSSWSTDTGSITFGNSNAVSTTATINGPGNITANFAVIPAATPTPTPVPTPTPTKSPTPSPSPTVSPTQAPTNSPSSSPTQSPSAAYNIGTYAVIGVVVALILVGVAAAVMVLRKRAKPSTFK
jgi:uncharacterized repeat protein (TIGR02543 family)